jgi:site-specific DNA recombinase
MKNFYGYIRVSTVRQGEHGVSLEQQREAIERYSQKNQLAISQWFEEQETAAKRGRPVFGQMLKLLRLGKAAGVIIHKIDRSARNLKDWADLGELIDSGIEVHFANESLDLHSRGGRLSADIQAVVAADYIRNLREETKKGFYGRLKQGIDPRPAVIGYLDRGAGKPKAPDPVQAPLIRSIFEKYNTGRYNLDMLVSEMHTLGLRNKGGNKVTRNGMSRILNNPFYTGLIRIAKTNQTFPGAHQPIVPSTLFERVRVLLRGKVCRRTNFHSYRFRQLVSCHHCQYSLIGEEQKGYVYYRCHTKNCPGRCVREETLDQAIATELKRLEFCQEEKDYFRVKVLQMKQDWTTERQQAKQSLELRSKQLQDRQDRLTDAYLDKLIDKDTFEQRKTALEKERCLLKENLKELQTETRSLPDRLSAFLELAGNAYLAYKLGLDDEKRELLKILTSNRTVAGRTPMFMLSSPFAEVSKRFESSLGRPTRESGRDVAVVWDRLITKLLEVPALLQAASPLG